MKVEELLGILNIDRADLREEWVEQNENILAMVITATTPEAASARFPVADTELCTITGWEIHGEQCDTIALRTLKP